MHHPLKAIFAVIVILLFSSSCQTGSKKDNSGLDDLNIDGSDEILDRIDQIKKVFKLSPSPAEMLSIIDVAELDYLGEDLNPPGNSDMYLDMTSQTLNLGVYIADLAYAALFGRHQETLEYLETVRKMSEEVRVSGAVSEKLLERARENVETLDSLFNISNEAFINMLNYCEKNNRPGTISLLSMGAFIESMYLSVNMVESYDATSGLMDHLAEQKYALDNLAGYAQELKDDDAVANMLADMQPIRDVYARLDISGGPTTVKKDSSSRLVIGGGKNINLGEQDFKDLREAVTALRAKITGNTQN